MGTFDIPPEHVAIFKALASLDDGEMRDFVLALHRGQPAIKTADYGRSVAENYKSNKIDVKASAELLAEIWQSADASDDGGVTTYIHWLLRQIARAEPVGLTLGSKQSEGLRKLFEEAFTNIPSLEIAAKARNLLFSYEYVYQSAVVLTDIRPAFKNSPPEPAAALIVHNLKLTVYKPGGDTDEKYIALDSLDVQALIDALQRALQKEQALTKLLDNSELRQLKPSQRYTDD